MVADKVVQTSDLTILDIGILVFREHDRNDESNLQGKRFRTNIYLGIDPFFYFETLSKIPGVPPLIYSWRINSIFRETAPFIATRSPSGGTLHVRDQSKLALETVQSTNAWKDDKGHASYVLECELLPVPAVRRLNRAT